MAASNLVTGLPISTSSTIAPLLPARLPQPPPPPSSTVFRVGSTGFVGTTSASSSRATGGTTLHGAPGLTISPETTNKSKVAIDATIRKYLNEF